MLKVGTCGWSSFPAKDVFGGDWKKKFNSKLQAYASKFDVVEINSTFYKLPMTRTAIRWREEANEVDKNFEFTVKAPRQITHEDRFSTKKSREYWEKTVEISEILETKVILIQTPASFKPSKESTERISKFLEFATSHWKGMIAWEPRGEWLNKKQEVERVVSEFGLIHCVDPFRTKSVSEGRIYWRLHGMGKPSMYKYKFSDEELEWLADKVSGKSGYIFFNNIWMGQDALRFLGIL